MHARWTLTVPLILNDGTPTPAHLIESLESDILDIANGFTASAGEGVWRGPSGRVYREPNTVYTFDVSYVADHTVRHLAGDIAAALQQEGVYVTRQDITTWIEEPAPLNPVPAGARAE